MSTGQEWSPRVRRTGDESNDRLQHVGALMREEHFNDARDELLVLLHEDENSIPARMMLGAVYLRQQMHVDALDQFKYAIALEPMQVQAHVLAGTCCLRLNDIDAAQALLRTALDLDPKQATGHVAMAQLSVQTGDAAAAVSHLEEALRLDPQMESARMLKARLLSQAGNLDAAIEELTSLVHTNPEHTGASLQLAMMLRQKGHNEAAVELIEAAVKSNPESAKIWDLLGRMKTVVKDYGGAEQAFREAIAHKTTDRATPLRLVDTLIKQGKLDRAREMLQTMPRRGRMKAVVQRFYGDIYAARKLYDEAVESYRASILHTPGGDEIMAAIDAAAGPGADSEAMMPHYHAAFVKMREERRAAEAEAGGGRRGDGAGLAIAGPRPSA